MKDLPALIWILVVTACYLFYLWADKVSGVLNL